VPGKIWLTSLIQSMGLGGRRVRFGQWMASTKVLGIRWQQQKMEYASGFDGKTYSKFTHTWMDRVTNTSLSCCKLRLSKNYFLLGYFCSITFQIFFI